jgi:hypothetical protein
MKKSRTIQIKALDPTGCEIDKSRKMNYYKVGYRTGKTPEEYPINEEPMRKVRYLLSIGDYEYLVNRDGRITEVIVGPEKQNKDE